MRTLVVIAVAGLATILLLAGLGPAQASAVVHAAELGTTLVSGVSHWKFGNVHWPTVLKLGVPGGIAAFAGATVLSHVTTAAAAPLTAVILVAIGINLVWRFSRGRARRDPNAGQHHKAPFLAALGVVGGFVDASGGGGWGPVTTSTLMAIGREQPRKIVGTVNTAEFLVTVGATVGFAVGLWPELVAHAAAVAALLSGGVIGAPVAAWLISRVNPVALGGLVGTAIVVLNLPKIVAVPWFVLAVLAAVGVALTVRGFLRYRAEGGAPRHHEQAEDPTRAADAEDTAAVAVS